MVLQVDRENPNYVFPLVETSGLEAITRESSIALKPAQQGDLEEMAAAWLLWGKDHGYRLRTITKCKY